MKKLASFFALVIGLSTAAFAHEGGKGDKKASSNTTAFQMDVMVYKTPKFALHFQNGADHKVTVTVSDQAGNVLHHDRIRKTENLSKTYLLNQFPAGTYRVEVKSGNETMSKEIEVRK